MYKTLALQLIKPQKYRRKKRKIFAHATATKLELILTMSVSKAGVADYD
jgi:hypothetical protein